MMPGHFSACPTCGQSIRRRRPTAGAIPAAVDPSQLSDAELYRSYRRTAPVEDLRFFLQHARLSADLRALGDALLTEGCRETGGTVSRTEWYRRLTALQDRWRQDTRRSEVATPIAEAV
jgi:hypothetical protein